MASLLPSASISPRTLIVSPKPRTRAPILPVFSLLSLPKSSRSLSVEYSAAPGSMVFALRVAVSSELELEEEKEAVRGEGEPSFAPELKLFVGNLPFSVDSAELAGLFKRAGTVEMVEVIYDKLTGKSRGFGFVTMSCVDEVEAAEKQFNGYELEGRPLRVSSGPPPPKDSLPSRGFRTGASLNAANRVYVGNLAWGVDNLALEALFSEQGKVMEAKVVYDRESGRSRGFGFVTYSTPEEVHNAISLLNGVDLDGRNIRVTLAEARQKR